MKKDLEEIAIKARKRLLLMHYDSKVGHIGGNLSCLDILLALHHCVMSERDTFILSKGHSAGALYVTMWSLGKLSDSELSSFHKDNTKLAGHPIAKSVPGSFFTSGSLGHGLGIATGIALARSLIGSSDRVFCLTSDGEWQEGSTWESFHFLTSRQLKSITVLVDENGLQGFGSISEIMPLPPLAKRLSTFDVDVVECSGHDLEQLVSVLSENSNRPRVVILKTVKGKGVSFMENKMEWHYRPLSKSEYLQACEELDSR